MRLIKVVLACIAAAALAAATPALARGLPSTCADARCQG